MKSAREQHRDVLACRARISSSTEVRSRSVVPPTKRFLFQRFGDPPWWVLCQGPRCSIAPVAHVPFGWEWPHCHHRRQWSPLHHCEPVGEGWGGGALCGWCIIRNPAAAEVRSPGAPPGGSLGQVPVRIVGGGRCSAQGAGILCGVIFPRESAGGSAPVCAPPRKSKASASSARTRRPSMPVTWWACGFREAPCPIARIIESFRNPYQLASTPPLTSDSRGGPAAMSAFAGTSRGFKTNRGGLDESSESSESRRG